MPDDYHVVKNALQYTGIIRKLELVISGIKAIDMKLNAQKRNENNMFVKVNKIGNKLDIILIMLVIMGQKIKRIERKVKLSGSFITMGKRFTLKSIIMILLESKNKKVMCQ